MLSLPIPHMVCCYPVTIPLSVYDPHFPAPQRKPLGPSRSGTIGPYGARRPLARMTPFFPQPLRGSTAGRYRCVSRLKFLCGISKVRASNVDVGAGVHGDGGDAGSRKSLTSSSDGLASPKLTKPESGVHYLLSIAGVLLLCTAIFSVITITKGDPSVILAGFAKSGFAAAFTLIFVSEIGDKTFFIAALLAMQYDKAMVLCGSMGALSLMTILSVVIGRIFHSVPTQFHTTLPIGEYAAVALLAFFGLKSIKDAWKLSSNADANHEKNPEIGELVEAEELVKEKVSKSLKSPLEILWKSFSLVFFAEWGDRSMLATIALGVAQSPWGVASGAITGHLFATSVAIIGGAFLATYISEKLVGFVGGVLFLVFSVATLFGAF
ncbi:GDT1-like protein 2, chloroplastic [Apostasia shenzhenica]|uniref:GDT1 family protein n=1 Tax=Apostasia shenzhenica TaxID=1088818 RepID=A0A2I0A3V5_9ASPA|nr:GDT1-like protein 2, chloroplastic [Apostasia shenzhenica]